VTTSYLWDQPDDEIWNGETGETFAEARARFATFGEEVDPAQVPALVRAGNMVWSFGYGDDPEAFTTISDEDLDIWDSPKVVASWAPFRLDSLSSLVAPAPAADDLVRMTIRSGITDAHVQHRLRSDPTSVPGFDVIATAVLAALAREGIQVLTPADLNWGKCPGGGPHHVSTSLCAICLEYDPE
jgi:hypothetical protein